jgi:hypothetical protein
MKAVVLSPFYAIRIFSTVKSFRDPVLGSVALNRRGLHAWRVMCAARITARRRQKLTHLLSEEDRRSFGQNGYIERRDFLPAEEFRRLVGEVETLAAPSREMMEGGTITRRMALSPGVLRDRPAIRAFLRNPGWSDAVRYVGGFDVEPVMTIQAIVATPPRTPRDRDPQTNLHMDTFHSTVKAWFFLHDVREEEGPLRYIAGSHKLTRRRLAWHKRMSVIASCSRIGGAFRLPDRARKSLCLPEPHSFVVPANTLVVADTFGFHARGHTAKPSIRIEFFAAQRINPFIPFVGLDTARLPFVSGRKQQIAWLLQDWMKLFGLGHPTMHRVGTVLPAEVRSTNRRPERRVVGDAPDGGVARGR